MKHLKLMMICLCMLSIGAAANAAITGAVVTVRSQAGITLHDRVPLHNVILGNVVSTSGLRPSQILLSIGTSTAPAMIRVTSSSHERIIDLHRAIATAMQTGNFSLHMYVSVSTVSMSYEVNLDTNLFTLLQY